MCAVVTNSLLTAPFISPCKDPTLSFLTCFYDACAFLRFFVPLRRCNYYSRQMSYLEAIQEFVALSY